MKLTREFNIESIDDVAREVLKNINSKVILFYGEMGVGKTTFISAFVKALGGINEVSSPTFSIVNEYKIKDDSVYHFDFYRIKNVYEALDIGVEDYFESGKWIFIEWPEKISEILPENVNILRLSISKTGLRKLILE